MKSSVGSNVVCSPLETPAASTTTVTGASIVQQNGGDGPSSGGVKLDRNDTSNRLRSCSRNHRLAQNSDEGETGVARSSSTTSSLSWHRWRQSVARRESL